MTWWGLLLRNLIRRPARSAFTLLGVALAVTGFLTLTGLSRGMQDATQSSLRERGIDLVVMQRGMVEFFASNLPESLADDIRRVTGVEEVIGELGALMPVGEDRHALIGGWQSDARPFREAALVRGRLPEVGEAGVLLGEALAGALGADVGSSLSLQFTPVQVTGIARFASTINNGAVIMPLANLQVLLGRPGQVTMFQLRLSQSGDAAEVARVTAAIAALRPGLFVSTPEEATRNNRTIAMMEASSSAIALAALVMACLLIVNTLVMTVEERTHEIGILAAVGWSRRRIIGLILGEGVVLAAAGGIVGTVLGLLAARALHHLVMLGSGVVVDERFSTVLAAIGYSILLGGIGALYPAWRASRLSPTAALRRL